jgi:hyaluronate lyase
MEHPSMWNHYRKLLLVLAVLSCGLTAHGGEYERLRLKWRDMLTQGTNSIRADPLYSNWIAQVESTGQSYLNSLDTSAGRTNLFFSYRNLATDSSDITTTYEHLRAMALAYAVPGSALQGNVTLLYYLTNSLDWMIRYYSPTGAVYDNWYDFEIAIPRALNDTTVLLYSNLSPAQINVYMGAVEHFAPTPNSTVISSPVTGYNKVWKSLIVALRGIIVQDAAKIDLGRAALSDVFTNVTVGDGFYADGSFIFHDEFAYNTGYGVGLLDTMGAILQLLEGSTWQPTDPARTNVFRWVYDAYEPFIVRGAAMEMVDGRYHSRDGDSHERGHAILGGILRLAQVAAPSDAAAFKSFVKAAILSDTARPFIENQVPPYSVWASGLLSEPAVPVLADSAWHRQFPGMDRVVHHTPRWTFGLSMSSSRVANYETTRGENLKGWFTGEGMTYLYNNDLTHYSDNFWSTINPYRLAGTTIDTVTRTNGSGDAYNSPNNQVGGASILGLYGAAAMHLNAYGTGTVSARLSWFLFDNEVVCLANSISSVNGRETIVENRRLGLYGNNSFTVNGTVKPSGPGWSETMATTSWAHLAGSSPGADIGYYFPSATTVKALRESRSGRFYDINTTYGSKTPFTRHYLTMSLDHGTNSGSSTYSYVLLPGFSSEQVAAYAANPDIMVVQNNSTATAVRKPRLGITAANFWKDTSNQVAGISSDHKASVILRNDGAVLDIGMSDPTQTNKVGLRIEVNSPAVSLMSADPGIVVLQLAPTLKLLVNTSNQLGATLKAKFLLSTTGQPPVVSLAPPADVNMDAPATVLLNAMALDPDGTIGRLDFYSNTTRVAQVLAPPSTNVSVVISNLSAGSYAFTVVAIDNAGLSTTSAAVNLSVYTPDAPGRGIGLVGDYFKDLGEFRVLALTRTDGTVNFSWPTYQSHPIPQSDHFSVRWTGRLQAQHSGWHQFLTQTDEGVRLWIDGRQLIDNWTSHAKAVVEDASGMSLVAGRYYDIRMEFYDNSDPAVARLYWVQPGGMKEVIPQSQLYPASTGLQATYFNGTSLAFSSAQFVRIDDTVNFAWGTNTPDPTLLPIPFAARWTGKLRANAAGNYTFFTLSDDAVKLYVNGQLIINNWTPHGLTENSNTINLPTPGQYYYLTMEYFNLSGPGTAALSWQPPDSPKQIIPSANLTPYQNNCPPELLPIADSVVARESLVTFVARATDADGATASLIYSLEPGAPAGATINSSNGVFEWTPSSAQPGGRYKITARVMDAGIPAMTDSQSFTITVLTPNTPPLFPLMSNRQAVPGNLLTVPLGVTDADLPAQTLTCSLVTGPAGAIVDSAGAFSWTPSAAQASSTNLVTLRVTDNGVPPLSATQSFTVFVSAVNPCVGYKGDVAPRLAGNGLVTIADWAQIGRFAAGLSEFSNACEYASADCSPKPCGDGLITISDWVQAGRYAAGFDSLVQIGGCPPSSGFTPAGLDLSSSGTASTISRSLSVSSLAIEQGQTNWVQIILDAQGDENALGFSLRFDTNLVWLVSVKPGEAASGALFNVNTTSANAVGVAMALPAGTTFARGRSVVAEICLGARTKAHPASALIRLVDQPIRREVDNDEAKPLRTRHVDGTVTVTCGTAFRFESIQLPNADQVKVSIIGKTGVVWHLQASADLANWQTMGRLTNETGRVEHFDVAPRMTAPRFYRAQQP